MVADMIGTRPSQTSLPVAAARAAHMIVDHEPRIFAIAHATLSATG